MNKIKTTFMGLSLLALTVAAPAIAFDHHVSGAFSAGLEDTEGGHHRHHNRLDALASRLDLSKEQADKLHEIKNRYFNETTPIRKELLEKRLEIRRLFTDPTTDEATILAKQKEIELLQQRLQEKRIQFRLEQRRVLTPQQLKQLNEITTTFDHDKCWS